jgi:hypothetical protein
MFKMVCSPIQIVRENLSVNLTDMPRHVYADRPTSISVMIQSKREIHHEDDTLFKL